MTAAPGTDIVKFLTMSNMEKAQLFNNQAFHRKEETVYEDINEGTQGVEP